jgi:hypothetical protein
MPLYRILNNECQLQSFRSIELGSRYQERDLENWIETNPQVMVDDEPLLIIGRQVSTPVGVMDLLALDSEGAGVIIELKRAPNQREAIAQSLEYAAWFSGRDFQDVRQIAESYLKQKPSNLSLEQAWQQTFGSELQETALNTQQRIFVVIEGENERIASIARYLRVSGLDINLLKYSYYRTEGNEEILQIEKQVGDEETVLSTERKVKSWPTENSLVESWNSEVQQVYVVFREQMVNQGLSIRTKKTGISFYKQTRDDLVFVCFVNDSHGAISVWLRSDSLQARFDFESVVQTIRDSASPDIRVKHTPTWFILTPPATVERVQETATVILREIVERIE